MSLIPLTPEEKRRHRLQEKRRAVRTVRNTLLIIALLAGLWYIYLVYKDSPQMVPIENIGTPQSQETQTQQQDKNQSDTAEKQ